MPTLENVSHNGKSLQICLTDCGPSDFCNPDDYCNPDDSKSVISKKNDPNEYNN